MRAVTGAVVAALVAAVAGAGCSHGHTAASLFSPAGTDPAPSYQVLYRVERPANGPAVSWELLSARRPFLVRDALFDRDPTLLSAAATGPTPPPAPTGGTLTTVDELYSFAQGQLQTVSARQPSPGTADQDLVTVAAEAVRRGLAAVRGEQQVAGASCEVVRFHDPPAGALTPLASDQHDDVCLDRQGIVRSEVWTRHGAVVLRRQAVRVDVGPVPDGVLSAAGALDAPPGAGQMQTVAPGSEGTAPPEPPAGFVLAGVRRFAFPDTQAPIDSGALVYGSVVWTFTRGIDVVTVESAGGRPDVSPVPSQTHVSRLRLPALGSGVVAVRSDGFEIDVVRKPGSWVRIRGTVPLDQLTAYARSLPDLAGPGTGGGS